MKTCNKCHQELPEERFGFRPSGKPHTTCKSCRTAYHLEWNAKNADKVKEANRKAAKKRYERIKAGGVAAPVRNQDPEVLKERALRARAENPLRTKLWGAKARAKQMGLEFTITESDLQMIDVCPVLGIPLDWSPSARKDNTPSIDRFDSSKGYVPGNVAIISWRANNLKSNGTLDEFKRLVEWMASCS